MTKRKNKADAPKIDKPKVEKDFFPISDFADKVKMKLNGNEFHQSPLLVLRDTDAFDEQKVLTYKGKGEVKGYAHQGGGPLMFSSSTGVYLGNVTEFSI